MWKQRTWNFCGGLLHVLRIASYTNSFGAVAFLHWPVCRMPLVWIAKAVTLHVETFPPPSISSLARHLRASGSAGGSLSMLVRCLLNWFIPVLLLALWQGLYIYIYKSNQTTNSSHYLYLCKHAFWRTPEVMGFFCIYYTKVALHSRSRGGRHFNPIT